MCHGIGVVYGFFINKFLRMHNSFVRSRKVKEIILGNNSNSHVKKIIE